jgi:hypothetical protein
MIMSTTIRQTSVAGPSPYAVTSDSSEPSPSPSTSSSGTSEGGLQAPFDLPSLGDPVSDVAALLAMMFREDRKHARESSDLEEVARLREGEKRVEEMHEKADEIRGEGLARGLSQIASAGCSVAGGALSLSADDPHDGETLASLCSGGGKGFDAAGTIQGSDFAAAAVEHQAQADRHDSLAEAKKVARDKFAEEASDARQMIQKVMDFVKEMNEVRNATLQTVASFKA